MDMNCSIALFLICLVFGIGFIIWMKSKPERNGRPICKMNSSPLRLLHMFPEKLLVMVDGVLTYHFLFAELPILTCQFFAGKDKRKLIGKMPVK